MIVCMFGFISTRWKTFRGLKRKFLEQLKVKVDIL